jgi:hypothetical protein
MPKTPLTHHLVALWFADIAGYIDGQRRMKAALCN